MQKRKFNVITDGNWGSCGKGLITTALAAKHRPEIISTTNMANAGHTAVFTTGQTFIAKAIPSASMLNAWIPEYNPHILVGASAAFDLERMLDEITMCGLNYSTSIHPRAGVITEVHHEAESGDGDSSTKHIASTMQGCGTFVADKVLRKAGLKLARDYPELAGHLATHMVRKLNLAVEDQNHLAQLSIPEILHALMASFGYTILHEGSQGFSLDINHGSHYPQCTSRGTTAIQNIADMGINLSDIGDIYLVIRPYPIRVGNVVENGETRGYSGDCYDDHHETTWADVAKAANMPQEEADLLTKKELTTVTKRLRRVFTFSERQLKEAALVNGATKIALNFANYIDWSCYGINQYDDLPKTVKDYIRRIEDLARLPVTLVGTGPRVDQVCFL